MSGDNGYPSVSAASVPLYNSSSANCTKVSIAGDFWAVAVKMA